MCLLTRGPVVQAIKEMDGAEWRRSVACIFYLTKGWDESLGGAFVDLQTGERHVPVFNSLVAFKARSSPCVSLQYFSDA